MKRGLAAFCLTLLLWSPLARAADDDDSSDAPTAEVEAAKFPPHRYAFIGGGVLLAAGLGLGYWAHGQGLRASSLEGAKDSREQFQTAQATAQAANLMYGMAAAAIVYGLVLEILPEPAADKASLTFHF